ncbi:MAG: UvrD-helicase domain-containing protein [Muribaculaceae bacterium]|nr:UvrD-helicase domain-containing protein [Muribaculaceae bacterium]
MLDASQLAAVTHRGSRALLLAGPGCGKTHILAERVAWEHETFGTDFGEMLCLTFTNRAARAMRDRVAGRLGCVPEGLFVGNLHRFCISMLRANGLINADTGILDEDDAAEFLSATAHMSVASWRSQVQAMAVDRYMRAHEYPANVFRKLWFTPDDYLMACVEKYERFKRDNNLMDFDDCLLWAFDALRRDDGHLRRARYGWIQIDEVQDLTPLQLAIVSLLAPAPDATVLYLGDEQQAIFEFLGAGAAALSRVRRLCNNRIMRLHRNYRSSFYLVELCNALAASKLEIDPVLLPDVGTRGDRTDDDLTLWRPLPSEHKDAVAGLAKRWFTAHTDQTTAILVRTNAELAEVHRRLESARIPHMAVGAHDCFKLVAFKTVLAHMAVALNPMRSAEWARLLYQTGCVRRIDDATEVVMRMREVAMTPACLLSADGLSAVERAVMALDNGERVVTVHMDSPTSFCLQAMRHGEPEGEAVRLAADDYEGLQAFIAGSRLCYHGEAAQPLPAAVLPPVDTLELARLLFPMRRSNTLGELLELFGNGTNNSYASPAGRLLQYLAPMLREKFTQQEGLAAEHRFVDLRRRIATAYGPLYFHTKAMLERRDSAPDNCLTAELDYVYRRLSLAGRIEPLPRWSAMLRLLGATVTDTRNEPDLRTQLRNHLHELSTFNEGDIFDKGMAERLTVMTVHKAKGLEMDNVIVYNANSYWDSPLEKARVFYVAFSRARRRLAVFAGSHLSSALEDIEELFTHKSASDAHMLAKDL